MNKSYKTAAIIIVGIVLLLASGIFFPSEDTDSNAATTIAPTLMAVSVINPTSVPYEKDIVLRGFTESRRSVDLKSQVKGRIIDLPIEKGMRVNTGDIICRIDVEDREANYAESIALVKQRQLEFAASEKLFSQGHRSETQHSAAKSALDASLARSTRMKIDLENTTIKAPFNGVINDRPIEVGDYMKIGESCAMIVEEDPFLVVADISERQITQARVGDMAHAILQNGRRLEGKIRYVSAVADKNTRTFRVELEVANPNKDIRDGITAELFLKGDEILAQKISPATLVLNDKGLVGVRIVDTNNQVQFSETEILGNHEDGIWISALPANEKIIIKGHEFVKAGEIVNPILDIN